MGGGTSGSGYLSAFLCESLEEVAEQSSSGGSSALQKSLQADPCVTVVQYELTDVAGVEKYLSEDAPAMRQEAFDEFGDEVMSRIKISRKILKRVGGILR